MKKVLISILLILFCTNVLAGKAFLLEAGNVRVSPEQIYPGDRVTLSFDISSTSDSYSAQDVKIELILNENYFEPIKMEEIWDTIKTDETKTAIFSFRVKKDTYPALYKVIGKMEYKNNLGEVVKDTGEGEIRVSECYFLDVKDVKISDYTPLPGSDIEVKATIANTCSSDAKEVEVMLESEGELNNFLISETTVKIPKIEAFQQKEISYVFKVSDNAEPSTALFHIEADCLGCEKVTKNAFSFEVLGKPDVILSGIDFSIENRDGKKLIQGDTFSMSVQMDNIGTGDADAVKVILGTPDDIKGTKESYVGTIEVDDSGAAIFDLSLDAFARVGEHKIEVTVEYLDDEKKKNTILRDITIFVDAQAPESPLPLLGLIIVILVLVYFIVRMIFRQLAIRKAQKE